MRTLSLLFSVLALVVGTLPTRAAPAPGATSGATSGATGAADAEADVGAPAAGAVADVTARFDGVLVTASLAGALARKRKATLVAWDVCRDDSAPIDHCLQLLVTSGGDLVGYTLVDTACGGDGVEVDAAACFAGYVVALRSDTVTAVDADGLTTITTSLRVGRKRPGKGTQPARFDLPSTPLQRAIQTLRVSSSQVAQTLKIQVGDATLVDESWQTTPSSGGGGCARAGKTAEASVLLGTLLTASATEAAYRLGASRDGVRALIVGTATGSGRVATIRAVRREQQLQVAVGKATAAMIAGSGEAYAQWAGAAIQALCEWDARAEAFEPESLPDPGEYAFRMESGGTSLELHIDRDACSGTIKSSSTDEDGCACDSTCELQDVDGECTPACETVCTC